MDLIDEDGNLLGVVNVIDALAVLFVLAVVVAGAALVFNSGGDENPGVDSTHVTLDLGQQPTYLVSAINAGDVHEAGSNSQLTLTDVYLAPQGGDARVIARAELQGPVDDDSISYVNAPPRLGRSLEIATSRYQVNGQLRAVGGDETLDRGESTVVVESTMSAADAREVTPGDEVRLAGRTVATVETVTRYATGNPERTRVLVGATLQTVTTDGRERFGAVPIQQGADVTLDTTQYRLSGRIQRVGTTEPRGSITTRTVTLRMGPVREEMATAIQPGMTEQNGDATIARVTDVEIEPSVIIATGDNGSVNVVDHPFNRQVLIMADLRVRETVSGVQFKGQSLRQGQTVSIDLGTVVVRATVVRVGA
jgi:hypothetical protein